MYLKNENTFIITFLLACLQTVVDMSTYSIEPVIVSQQENAPAPDSQIPESLWTNAFWHSPLKVAYNHRKLVFVLRTYENVSTVFGPNWHRMSTRTGKYRPFDMNMPFTIPALTFSTCETDPPLTVFGKFSAQTVARSLRNQLFKIPFIVCAPSLRCVQTACTFAEVMETNVYILEELAEPEIIQEYGSKTAEFGKYLSIDQLRKCGFKVQGLRLNVGRPPNEEESDLGIMLRISQALRELTTQSPKGPTLIIGDALVVKIANSISSLPEGYSDPLIAKPFAVPSLELKSEEDAIEMDRYDFTQLDEHFPFGTMNVFLRQKDENSGAPEVMRIPYTMPKFTVSPENDEKEKERELKAAKPENVISIQQSGPIGGDSSGSEISIN